MTCFFHYFYRNVSDGSRYEKRIDARGRESEPVCIDGEIPFEIPEDWEWARLCDLADFAGGKTPSTSDKSNYADNGIPWVTSKDMKRDFIDSTLVTLSEKGASGLTLFSPGTILMVTRSGILRRALPVAMLKAQATVNQDQKAICPFDTVISLWLLVYLKASDIYIRQNCSKAGTTVESIVFDKVKTMLVPIPPLVEQHCIVERVSELMPLVEEYGRLEDERETLDAALPERLRKSVLQMAVEGKLVPQDPGNEPASALLEHIRAERAKLIKEKKIKAPKGGEAVIYLGSDGRRYEKRVDAKGRESEPVCIDEEIPFEIPEGWEWARLSSVCVKLTDGSHNPPPKAVNGYPVISAMSIDGRSIDLNRISRFADRSGFEKENPRTRIKRGDIILGIIGGSIGNVAIFDYDEAVIAQRSVAIIDCGALNEYVSFALESPLFFGYYKNAAGTAQGGIYLGALGDMLVPIPPLAEQYRIVECLGFVLASIS